MNLFQKFINHNLTNNKLDKTFNGGHARLLLHENEGIGKMKFNGMKIELSERGIAFDGMQLLTQ